MSALPTTFARVPLTSMDPSMLVFELDRETRRLMPVDCELLTSAATMASFLHRDQTRFVRGNLARAPYVEHPLRVALRLVRWGVRDGEIIAAALLHDTAEDCTAELLKHFGHDDEDAVGCLARLYGARVAELVAQVTNPVACGSRDAASRAAYLEHVRALAGSDSPAMLIKASDLKDNAGSIRYQLGHGKDQKMLSKLRKYLPAVQIMHQGLAATAVLIPEHTAYKAASNHLRRLLINLEDLTAEHGIER